MSSPEFQGLEHKMYELWFFKEWGNGILLAVRISSVSLRHCGMFSLRRVCGSMWKLHKRIAATVCGIQRYILKNNSLVLLGSPKSHLSFRKTANGIHKFLRGTPVKNKVGETSGEAAEVAFQWYFVC